MAESDFEQLGSGIRSGIVDFVPAVFANDLIEAQRLKELLEERDIPVLIETADAERHDGLTLPSGIPVLVPTEMFEEATEILAAIDEDDVEESSEEESDEEEDYDDYDDEDLDDYDDDYDEEDEDLFYDDDEEEEDEEEP